MLLQRRPAKVRNAYGATAIAAYSTRARPGAPVAVPVTWEELIEGLDALAFDIRSVSLRLSADTARDSWQGYEEARAALDLAMFEAVGAKV